MRALRFRVTMFTTVLLLASCSSNAEQADERYSSRSYMEGDYIVSAGFVLRNDDVLAGYVFYSRDAAALPKVDVAMNQPGHTFIMDGKVVRNWDETRLLLITRDSVTGELRTEEVSADTLRTVREQILSHTYMENVRHDEPSGD